jgi:cell division protein FtsB
MSRGTRRSKGEAHAVLRPAPRRDQKGFKGLRVIEGGRASGQVATNGNKQAKARRCELPGKVKRRRRVVMAVLVVLAAGLITYILLGPVTRVIESRRNLSQTETQLAEERSRTLALEERKALDMTDRFVEMEAREMGYVKPGEIPIVVLDHEEEDPAAENTPDMLSP